MVNKDVWFLLIHDTCKMHKTSSKLIEEIILKYDKTDNDIVWLSHNGKCNLCLIRREGVTSGYRLYKDIMIIDKMIIDKMRTVHMEWNMTHDSPKRLPVKQAFVDISQTHIDIGSEDVY